MSDRRRRFLLPLCTAVALAMVSAPLSIAFGQPARMQIDPRRFPGQQGQPGQPGQQMPPMPHGGPGRFPQMPPQPPRPPVQVEAPKEKHPDEENCPNHGPDDPPHPVNWWRGLIMVNNKLAQSDNFIYQLLFRYENDENPCDEKNDPPPFLASVLNFGVLAFVLFRYGRKPLHEALVKRRKTIMGGIETASRLKEEAEARLEEYEEKFENIHDKLASLRADYAEQSEAEKRHIIDEAETRRVRMRKDAEFRVEQELKTAQAELLRESVEAAALAAEKLLVERAKADDFDRLADEYLRAIGPSLRDGARTGQRAGGAS